MADQQRSTATIAVAARSRALREAVRNGWDDEAVRQALEASVHATLF